MRLVPASFRAKLLLTVCSFIACIGLSLSGCQKIQSVEETESNGPDSPPVRNAASVDPESIVTPWHDDLNAAIEDARRSNRPILVMSIVGDLGKRC